MPRPLSKDDVLKIRTGVFFDFSKSGELSPVYKAVLQPINVYAPLSAYYQLYDALRRMAVDGFEEDESETAAKLYEELTAYFLSEECRRNYVPNLEDDYLWARVIIILTMKVFAESGNVDAPQEIMQAYLSPTGENSVEAILTQVQQLYGTARTTPAGGAAFHFIANILLLSKTLSTQYVGQVKYQILDHYLDLTRRLNPRDLNSTTDGKFNKLSLRDDCCLAFLRNKWLDRYAPLPTNGFRIASYNFTYPNASEKSGAWWSWRKNKKEQPAPEHVVEKTITGVMIGPSGSGKTTLVRQLVRANKQAVELGIGLQIKYGSWLENNIRVLEQAPPPGTQHMILLQGVLSLDKSHRLQHGSANGHGGEATRIFFNIYDSKGGSMYTDPPPLGSDSQSIIFRHNEHSDNTKDGEKLYEVTTKADLLVLFIPPEYLTEVHYTSVMNWDMLEIYFSNFVAQVSQWNKNAMIAIAYTKCDEYGVRLSRSRRIIEDETTRTALDTYRDEEEPKEVLWQSFVSAASKRGEGGESQLVHALLTKTSTLWKNTLRHSKHPFLNGYMVSAEPVVDALGNGSPKDPKNWESLGLLQIFADFFAHLKAMKTL